MINDLHRIIELIEGDWRNSNVLVIGDIMLDRYIWGNVERISPEAPVPVVRAEHRSDQPGGAANVAMNIAGLGARVMLLGFVGQDEDRLRLEECLRSSSVDAHLTLVPGHPTTSKLRILGGNQQILRLDTEKTDAHPREAYEDLLANLGPLMAKADAVVLSDYAKGVLTEQVCQSAIALAREQRIPVLVDPKHRSFERYRGATTICPNLRELSAATGFPSEDTEAMLQAAQGLVSRLGLDQITATLSEKGIVVLTENSRTIFPAVARQVYDVSGAGDTVIATLALCLASHLEIETAVQLANVAAGIVVSKIGTVPVQKNELLSSLMPEIELHAEEKVLPLGRLQARVSAWRSEGRKIVFTNGCFDLLHIGHIMLLENARREGDRLIVAINSDASVSGLKGPTRPIVGEQERARILAALAAVDAVTIFDEATPLCLIEALRPDVLVKGGDYNDAAIVGAPQVRSWGGRVKIIPMVEGFSTTKLIARAAVPAG